MKSAHKLEKAGESYNLTTEDALEVIKSMPDEKLAELFSAGVVEIVVCESCGEKTWLIGAAGHNGHSDCHNCGEAYRVIG